MNSLPHIVSLFTAPWIPWMLLVALVLWFYAYISTQQRTFSRSNNWGDTLPTFVYKVIILAFILYVWVEAIDQASFLTYALLCAVVATYLLGRALCFAVVSYIFQLDRSPLPPIAYFHHLGLVLCLCLFPVVLVASHTGATMVIQSITLILIGAYLGLLSIKAVSAFRGKSLSWILFFIYLITVVLLPAGGAVVVAQHI